ncbi:Trp biosynthesis-associated membrane protein [Pseudonocardia sp. RS11V-5]|uniref:Trp biosynthesis-associated membrane protein n=1 Tax=Pseudonocardia terrae TaxID=2905831 RepID=UPI001E596392|nr:Trp biosynthesis-associated membrane protein [Pseudonocardia terrae]MCE3554571.1 Trp biosynthesis-associated membrane protein [Pseudonocardia terrae]
MPDAAPPARSGRLFLLTAALLLLGALGLWGTTRLDWASTQVEVAGHGATGAVPIAATGAQIAPSLIGLAVLAVAAVAAAIAVSGVVRRILGVILVLAGAYGVYAAASGWLRPPTAAELPALVGSAAAGATTAPGAAVATTAAPVLGVVGGLLVVAGGVVLVVADKRLPRMGARYDAPGAPRPADPERAAWDELDSGVDPTTEGAFARERGPDGGPRPGRPDGTE